MRAYQTRSSVAIQVGDSLQALAARHLGDVNLWVDLATFNGLAWPYFDFSGPGYTAGVPSVGGRVLGQGDVLLIPGPQEDPGILASDPIGSDVRPDGFRGLFSGLDNLREALLRRLRTPMGYLPHHPEYGSHLWDYVGRAVDASLLLKLRLEVAETLRQDPRIRKVNHVAVYMDGDAIYVDADAETIAGDLSLGEWIRRAA